SSSAVTLPIASGVSTGVQSTGNWWRSAAATISASGGRPSVMSTQGMSCANARTSASRRAPAASGPRWRTSLSPKTRRRPRAEIGVEAGEREARLLDVRARDQPLGAGGAGDELERQADELGAAAQQRRDAHTRRAGHRDRRASGLRLDETQIAVGPPVEDH